MFLHVRCAAHAQATMQHSTAHVYKFEFSIECAIIDNTVHVLSMVLFTGW